MLRPAPPGDLVNHAGDLGNRIKPLLDSLCMPVQASELPDGSMPCPGEEPFFVLLEDDALVTRLSVATDRMLEPSRCPMMTESPAPLVGRTAKTTIDGAGAAEHAKTGFGPPVTSS
jgi:hypothetical protein